MKVGMWMWMWMWWALLRNEGVIIESKDIDIGIGKSISDPNGRVAAN